MEHSTDYRFTGQEYEPMIDMYNFNQRDYIPNTAKFIQPDPVLKNLHDPQTLKQKTGQNLEQILSDPQNLNEYSYTKNNPVIYTDPEGEFGVMAGLLMAGIVFSGVFLEGIKTAQAPKVNSTPQVIGEKTVGDLMPVIKDTSKLTRFSLSAIVGFLSPTKFGTKIASKADDVIRLVHVSDRSTDIIKNGFNKVRGLWVNNLSKTNPFRDQHLKMHVRYDNDRMLKGNDYSKFFFEVPNTIYNKLIKDGLIDTSKTYETYIKPAAMKIINSYLKK